MGLNERVGVDLLGKEARNCDFGPAVIYRSYCLEMLYLELLVDRAKSLCYLGFEIPKMPYYDLPLYCLKPSNKPTSYNNRPGLQMLVSGIPCLSDLQWMLCKSLE